MAQGITNKTQLLLSSIELPEDAALHYSIYSPASQDPDALAALEAARRKLGPSLDAHLLTNPFSRVYFDEGKPLLYVFRLLSSGDDAPTTQLDDLTHITSNEIEISRQVSARMLCPENHGPCTCSHSKSKSTLDHATKAVHLAQSLFLDSVRDRLIDEICAKSTGRGHIPAVRLRNGFCLIESRKDTEWTEKWAKRVNNGLIFCEIQLHLAATHILVQPLPRRIITLAPLVIPSPGIQGSAILLLPHGIPAFYLGIHTADDRTACEFAESISSSGIHQSLSKEFARCYIPFRRISDRRDGGITTIWPRTLILANPTRPSLPTQLINNSSAPSSAIPKASRGLTTEMQAALSLTTLSLHSSPSLDALSSAMGIYVDASMKDRDRSSRQNTSVSQQLRPQQVAPNQSEQATQASFSTQQIQASSSAIQSQPVPEPLPESIQPPPAAAQSYPSPLEMLNQPQSHSAPAATATLASVQPSNEGLNPAPVPVDVPPPAQPQHSYPAQQMSIDPWDFGTGSFGASDGFESSAGFGLGGDTGMFPDTFSAAMFTDADFNFLDMPAVPGTSAAPLTDQSHNGDLGGMGDMMMDFTSTAQASTSGYAKLETGMLDWNLEFSSTTPRNVHVANPSIDEAAHLQQIFGVENIDTELSSSLLGPKTPGFTFDAPSIQIRLDSNSPMNLDRIGSDEIGEDEVPAASEGFLAVRFGKDIGLADEKYTSGKYSLPSPPPDDHTPVSRSPIPLRRMNSTPTIWPTPSKDSGWMSESRPTISRMNTAKPPLSRTNTTTPTGPWKSSTAREGDLRSRYMAATLPSKAVLYKLAGTKRHWEVPLPTTPRGNDDKAVEEGKGEGVLESPAKKRRLTWNATGEEWRNPTPPMEESEDEGDDGDSSVAGEDGWNEGMDLIGMDAAEPAFLSGSYKADGSMRFEDPIKLLNAQFDTLWIIEHEYVSPTDLILPPPGPSMTSTSSMTSRRSSVPPAPASVPTPVSPEALMGGNDNSNRLTVAVAQQFAQEMGKNVMWSTVVGAMRAFTPSSLTRKGDLLQADINVVLDALRTTKVEWGRSIEDFVEVNDDLPAETPVSPEKDEIDRSAIEHVHPFQSPKVYVGHGTGVIEAMPTIVRFWNQLNVTPLNGPKDVHAVALLSDSGGMEQVRQAEIWLERLGKEYAVKRFGMHIVAQLQNNPRGVASIRWDNFRVVCDRLVVAAKDALSLPLIVYVIVPNTFANLSHPSAAHVLNTMSEINDSLYNAPGKLIFHLIPEVFVSHSRSLSHNPDFGLERLALSVYDSVPRIVDREHSRLSSKIYSVRESIDAHAFVLANPRPKVIFVEKWPPPTASMFDRYAFLHVAYGVSTDGEWVTASVITETGDKQENRIWRIEEDEPFMALVKSVLDFTLKVARKADVDWRVTISKSGAMSTPEFEAWTAELAARVESVEQPMHLTLLSVTSGESPVFVTVPQLGQLPAAPLVAARSSDLKDPTIFVDSSSGTFLVFPKPVGMITSSIDRVIQADFLSSEGGETKSEALSMTPISTCWIAHIFRRSDWTPRQHDSSPVLKSTTSGCQIHALHLVRFGNSTYAGEIEEHMRNISKNFYDLMILNEMRRGSLAGGGTFRQPLHIALADDMAVALGGLQV